MHANVQYMIGLLHSPSAMAAFRILIVGAGLGGLMAACSVRLKSNHTVIVLEAAAQLQEV